MKMKITLSLCIIYSFFLEVLCRDPNTLSMVVSFLTDENDARPTNLLIPKLCWSVYYQKALARMLSDRSIFTASSFQPNRTEHLLQHIVFLADLSCSNVQDVLIMANKDDYFKSPYRWLLIDSEGNHEALGNLSILIDSDMVVARKVSENKFVFIEVYKIAENEEVIEITRGAWCTTVSNCNSPTQENVYKMSANGSEIVTKATEMVLLNLSPEVKKVNKYGVVEDYRQVKVLSSKRHNLRKNVLTMSNVVTDSNETRKHMDDRLELMECALHGVSLMDHIRNETIRQRTRNLHEDSIAKMSYMVVKICFEMLNATERLVFTHTWGYRDQNGNWQGQINLLINREADLGTLTIFTQERMQHVDYIAMVGSTAVRFVFREPPLAYVANIFALPFTGAVWLAILICVLGCSIFLYIASKWEASMSMHPLQLDGSWADVLILIIGAVLQQGCTLEPRYAAGRVATLLLFLALTILYAAYSANIVVLLRAPSSSVRTLPDLLNSPLKCGASDFEYNRYFFKKLNDPIRKAIYDKKIAPKGKNPYFYSMDDGVKKIRQGLFAFHMELNPGYRLIQDTYQEHEKCDLVEIDYINEIDPWVPGQKRGAFRDLFKINFMKIRESGIQSAIHRRLHVPRPHCSGTISVFSSVGLTDIYPALLMTLYGFLVAPVTLLLEITYKRLLLIRDQRKFRYKYIE